MGYSFQQKSLDMGPILVKKTKQNKNKNKKQQQQQKHPQSCSQLVYWSCKKMAKSAILEVEKQLRNGSRFVKI